MRKVMLGLYDRAHEIGEVTGSGPGFDAAMVKYKARQAKVAARGTWRKNAGSYYNNDGKFIDPDWYIVNWGQDEHWG